MALTHAILAFLIDCPNSGYDLAKQFDGSVGFFWKATHQQIYRELSKLEERGWIASQVIPQTGRPDKKLYHVTSLGKQQLQTWIAIPCEPAPTKDDLLVKIFAGYVAPREILLDELHHHRALHQQRLSIYQHLQAKYFQSPESLASNEQFRYLTLRNGILYENYWLTWCDEAIQLLSCITNQ